MLIFCDFIQVYVFTTNHHLNVVYRNSESQNAGLVDVKKYLN